MRSLRHRALVSAVAVAALSVLIVSAVLFAYIDRVAQARFDRDLADRHGRLVVALSNSAGDAALLDRMLSDPDYQRALSGSYWQLGGPEGTLRASASLFGTELAPPKAADERPDFWTGPAPEGGSLRGMQQRIRLDDGSSWTVAVAQSLQPLQAERADTRRSLLIAFAIVAALGILGAWAQTAVILRPLARLREDVTHRWERDARLDPREYPDEVAPLVADLDRLIGQNRDTVARARRQASDLAHALKTPAAILRNEITALEERGQDVGTALEALSRLDAQLRRSLARMRAVHSAEGVAEAADLGRMLDRMSRLFGAMAGREGKRLEVQAAPGLTVTMDPHDLEEILGNLLDNALKWSRETIRLTAAAEPDGLWLRVEDDGPGIPEPDRARALQTGARLDQSKPGTGLGLAIASDLIAAYGGRLELGVSETLNGLSVTLHLPRRLGRGP